MLLDLHRFCRQSLQGMSHDACELEFFHRRAEQLRHQVAVPAYCRTHREVLYVTWLCDQISYSHSFQMPRLLHHVVVGDRRLDELVLL